MSAARLAPLLLSALCLSACAERVPEALGRVPGGSSTATGGGAALASLPPAAGRVVAVRRTPYDNGVSQEIVIEGPRAMTGENRITVRALTMAGGVGRYGSSDELKLAPPTERDLAAEMEAQLPGVTMRVATTAERDAIGPFGYAVGTAGPLTCVYAWHYVAPARTLSLIEGVSDTGALPLSLRVRLCRDQPAATLIGYLRGLTLVRPGDGIAVEAARPGLDGDALAAAVGTPPPTPASAGAEEPSVDPAIRPHATHPVARAPSRHRPIRAAIHRASRHRVTVPRVVQRSTPRTREPDLTGLPRLPMPGDVTALGAAPRATAVASAPRSVTLDADAMPMPR